MVEEDIDETNDVTDAMEPTDKNSKTQLAAVLMLGGSVGGDARDMLEPFDYWALTRNIAVIARTPTDKLIIADTAEEIEQFLLARYRVDDTASYIIRDDRQLKIRREFRSPRQYRRERWCNVMVTAKGWRILKSPVIAEVFDEKHLLAMCIRHGTIVVTASTIKTLGATFDLEARSFFVTGAGSENLFKIRWNPRLKMQREYNKKRSETQSRRDRELPAELLHRLGRLTDPASWPSTHPYYNRLRGTCGDTENADTRYCEIDIADYIDITLRLWPQGRPWRTVAMNYYDHKNSERVRYNFRDTLKQALLYVHGIKHGNKDYRKIARWLIREAKAYKLIVLAPPRQPRIGRLIRKRKRLPKPAAEPVKLRKAA